MGGRFPTADGLGMIVFFWHNRAFIGDEVHARVEQLRREIIDGKIKVPDGTGTR